VAFTNILDGCENPAPVGILPSSKHTNNYGKSPYLLGKSTISMAMFNGYVKLPEGRLIPL